MENQKHASVVKAVRELTKSILKDILAGKGSGSLPRLNTEYENPEVSACFREIATLWQFNSEEREELTKYDLLASILNKCGFQDKIEELADMIVEGYPEIPEEAVSAENLFDLISTSLGRMEPSEAPQKAVKQVPKKQSVPPIADEAMVVSANDEPQGNQEPQVFQKKQQSDAYREWKASKQAQAEMIKSNAGRH